MILPIPAGKIALSGALHKVFAASQNAFDRGS
jgi:hypothetical protein